MYIRFEFNKSLALKKTISFLKFQSDFLNLEKQNYLNKKSLILNKISKELNEIAQNTIIILLSLEELDIEDKNGISNIITKINPIKKIKVINNEKVKTLLNNTIKNLGLIPECLKLFQNYITTILDESDKKNIHSKNFKISLFYKKNNIVNEYNKCCEQLIELISYFVECTNKISLQIEDQEILNFFVDNNS